MTQLDIKLLWGRAGALCSFRGCRRKLTEEPGASPMGPMVLGEQAHIVAEEPDGPRGQSVLSAPERDGYTNRILLCPTHHTLIDKDPQRFPVELLHVMKREQELWVEQQLTPPKASDEVASEVYAALVDACVEFGDLADWNRWTGWALGSRPVWRADGSSRAYELRQRIIGAAWPGANPELERAIKTFSICLNSAAQRFWQESETEGQERVGVRYYQNARSKEQYDLLSDRHEDWERDCEVLIELATRAANWMADVVRRDLNPRFFALEGRFTLTTQVDLAFQTRLPVFTADEMQVLPDGLKSLVDEYRERLLDDDS